MAKDDGSSGQKTERIIVKFKDSVNDTIKKNILSAYGDSMDSEIPSLDIKIVNVPQNQLFKRLTDFNGKKEVLYAEQDCIARAEGTPNDPYFN